MFQLGGELLSTLEKCRLPRNDENIKGIGWFLVCIGESLEAGSLAQSRVIRKTYGTTMETAATLGVAFCLAGDDIMNWGTALLHQEKK